MLSLPPAASGCAAAVSWVLLFVLLLLAIPLQGGKVKAEAVVNLQNAGRQQARAVRIARCSIAARVKCHQSDR